MSIESYLIYVLGKKILPNYWTKVWNSGHGVYPDSRKRKGFMHKIITKIIEPTKTITQSMKKQFVTWFIRFCLFKNRDEVLLNVKLLNPWVIFLKVLWSRYCSGQKKNADYDFAIPNFNHIFSANCWAFSIWKKSFSPFLDFFTSIT